MIRKTIVLLTLLCTFSGALAPVHAEDNEDDGTIMVQTHFYAVTVQENRTFEVPFNVDWFKNSAVYYNHNLTKASLAMAAAAFRPKTTSSGYPDENLLDFLMDTGFKDLRSDDYDKDPSRYTVSTVIGHQRIGEGDDAFELIAVGVCGQGYMDEWESNFSIGTSNTHDGFRRSSLLVYDRIFGYISRNNLQGPLKIWISGFSRAAAISNVTAAWLSDSGTFSQDTVFAYTFGTPNTTRNLGQDYYDNIYNICGKTDPVTMIPFSDWGYTRHGLTLYTPAQETDSDFSVRRAKADEVYKEITGIDYWTNTQMNDDLRVVMNYLLRICPDIYTYEDSLQDHLISLWEKHDAVSLLKHLLSMAEDPVLINEDNLQDANMFLNSVAGLAIDYVRSSNSFSRWNSNASTAANLLQSHTPELYMSWVFAGDNAAESFSASSDYSEVCIEGDVTVKLYRNGSFIEELETGDTENEKLCHHISLRNNGRILVMVPRDQDYLIMVTSNKDQIVDLREMDFTLGLNSPGDTNGDAFSVLEGDVLYIGYSATGNTVYSRDSDYTTSRSSSGDFYNNERLNFFADSRLGAITWRELVLFLIAAAVLLVSFVLFVISVSVLWLRFRHGRKRGFIPKDVQFRPLPVLCTFLIMQFFFIEEFQSALYGAVSSRVICYKAVIGILTIIIAFYGYRRRKDRMHLLLIYTTILLMIADILMVKSLMVGSVLHITAYVILTYTYFHKDMPGRMQAAAWIIFSAVGVYAVALVPGEFGAKRILAMVYVVAALAMSISSFHLSPRTSRGSFLLMVSGILLMYNQVKGTSFVMHIVSLGIYYTAVATLASSGSLFRKPKMIPATMLDHPEDAAIQ